MNTNQPKKPGKEPEPATPPLPPEVQPKPEKEQPLPPELPPSPSPEQPQPPGPEIFPPNEM